RRPRRRDPRPGRPPATAGWSSPGSRRPSPSRSPLRPSPCGRPAGTRSSTSPRSRCGSATWAPPTPRSSGSAGASSASTPRAATPGRSGSTSSRPSTGCSAPAPGRCRRRSSCSTWRSSRSRSGRCSAAGVAAAGRALLMRAYGTVVLVYPWNPYMPVLFWALLLVCVWGVLCGDLVLLPIAVVAGSLCAQTHISYVGLVGGLGLLVVAALAWQARVVTDPVGRRRVLRWAGASAVLGGLLWLPVAIDEVTGDPGNVSIIVDSFRHPVDPAIGLRAGWDVVAERLDPVRLVTGGDTGSTALGLVLVLAWLA